MLIRFFTAVSWLVFFLYSCNNKNRHTETPYKLVLPDGFPEMPVPLHNPLTVEKVELGRRLFFDTILSADFSISCASCHLPEVAFANHQPKALGIHGKSGLRNSPTLLNVGYAPYLFMEGKVPDLETQVIAPVQHDEEMGLNLRDLMNRLQTHPYYKKQFQLSFGDKPTPGNFVRALASFERTLISGNSLYDQYIRGDTSALNEKQKLGMDLFFSGRLQCSHCHSGFNFTNYGFENIGLYEKYEDGGLQRATAQPADEGKFKVPTLRNVAVTSPYMHNGSVQSLTDVIALYNAGGASHPNKSILVKPLYLSDTEQRALVAFLESLTDSSVLQKKWD